MSNLNYVGEKIKSMRKAAGLSQEQLAEILHVSPQAISKWENSHTLPETSLLPALSKILGCTIDEILMTGNTIDDNIAPAKVSSLNMQADYIASQVISKIGKKEYIGLSDDTILDDMGKNHFNLISPDVARGKEMRTDGKIRTKIVVSDQDKTYKLIETIYHKRTEEFYSYRLINGRIQSIPKIYHINDDKKLILFQDIYDDTISGYCYNEDNRNGKIFRNNYKTYLSALANFHGEFWEDEKKLEEKGLDWRHQTKENLLSHISQMERDFKNYRRKEEQGKIPKDSGECGQNNITAEQLDLFERAIQFLKDQYVKLIETRFNAGKNITIIHGDFHPGTTLLTNDNKVYFIGMQAVRIGLPTEDLAMFLALHIESEKDKSLPLLDYYYQCLCKKIKNYSYDTFISDYKITVAESMFFPIRLINRGIFDFNMRDKVITAFEEFVI